MQDSEVYKEIVPDLYLKSFWQKKTRNDNRDFTKIRELNIRRLDEKRIILNHGGNIVQSTFEIKKEKFKINSKALISKLNNTSKNYLTDKIKIIIENENYFILINYLKNFIINNFSENLQILKSDEILEINTKFLFSNNSSFMALAYSIFFQFYQFSIFINKFEKNMIFLPLHIKGFLDQNSDQFLWIFDPNEEEINLKSNFLQSNFFFILSQDKDFLSVNKVDGCNLSCKELFGVLEMVRGVEWRDQVRDSILKVLFLEGNDDIVRIF